jgi:SMC interacting uncharacterized protein involved in chromosome segregation
VAKERVKEWYKKMHEYLQLDIYMDKTWPFSKELTRVNVIACLGGAEWDGIIYAFHFMVYQKDSTLSPCQLLYSVTSQQLPQY